MADQEFIGAKVALFVGERLLVILRDDDRPIPWPGHWDFPGGGREPGETPEEVAIRETFEEVGLELLPPDLRGKRAYETSSGHIPISLLVICLRALRRTWFFGEEGQRWELWSVDDFLSHPKAVPQFQTRLKNYLESR
ncbi:MAG: NUDIX hydrolase [Rhodobacteraceae bacterium]|nr:NUDIX hydrolase [Paracoccaceae bacterium]